MRHEIGQHVVESDSSWPWFFSESMPFASTPASWVAAQWYVAGCGRCGYCRSHGFGPPHLLHLLLTPQSDNGKSPIAFGLIGLQK